MPIFSKEDLKMALKSIKIRDVMKTPVITIYEDDELSIAEEKFTVHGIAYLPVVDHSNQLVGLVSQKYLYKTQSPRRIIGHEEVDYNPGVIVDGESYYSKDTLDGYILRNIMRKNPLTLKESDSLLDAIQQMHNRVISCIPVIDNSKKIVGIMTIREVLDYLAFVAR